VVAAGLAAFLFLAVAAGSKSRHADPGATARATSSGRIAFIRTSPNGSTVSLGTANPDGSHSQVVPLANRPETFSFPAWSSDGTKLLISHTFRLDASGNCCAPFRPAIVNPDGSGFDQFAMSYAPPGLDCPTWATRGTRILCIFDAPNPGVFSVSAADGGDPKLLIRNPFGNDEEAGDLPTSISPNGKRFVFIRARPGRGANRERGKMTALFIANLDGTGLRRITPYGLTAAHEDEWAAWSPDGHKILSVASGRPGHAGPITCFQTLGACLATHSQLFTIHPDGSGYHAIKLRLPTSTGRYRILQPSWSPNGSRIVFCLWPTKGTEDIYTAKADGTHIVRVTHTPAFEYAPRWGPSH
jgi:WD40-like Beta Propeller Repeat